MINVMGPFDMMDGSRHRRPVGDTLNRHALSDHIFDAEPLSTDFADGQFLDTVFRAPKLAIWRAERRKCGINLSQSIHHGWSGSAGARYRKSKG
jgi:hypothetical protein